MSTEDNKWNEAIRAAIDVAKEKELFWGKGNEFSPEKREAAIDLQCALKLLLHRELKHDNSNLVKEEFQDICNDISESNGMPPLLISGIDRTNYSKPKVYYEAHYDISWKDHRLERGPVTAREAANIVAHHLREYPNDPIWLTPGVEINVNKSVLSC